MVKKRKWSALTTLAAILTLTFTTAWAHHGWTWAEEEQTEMTGTILETYVGNPHGRLQIATESDGEWQIDLGTPSRSTNAGFVESSVNIGDTVLVTGHRSRNTDQHLMKAVRITVNGQDYTFYPEFLEEG